MEDNTQQQSDSNQQPSAPAEPTQQQAPQIQPAKASPQSDPASSGAKKVLLVEDDEGLAQVYIARLEAEGFEVRRVPNGEDALAAATEFRPDVILLDIMMPKVSGFDVLDIIRNTPELVNSKIVMLTALSQESDRKKAEEMGADDFLVKSQVVIADVVERVKMQLGI